MMEQKQLANIIYNHFKGEEYAPGGELARDQWDNSMRLAKDILEQCSVELKPEYDIKIKIKALNDAKSKLGDEIKEIQDSCPHINLKYTRGGSSGNWDREDSYWFNFKCNDCGKKWTTEQSSDEGRFWEARGVCTNER